jgi:hypothetical protein
LAACRWMLAARIGRCHAQRSWRKRPSSSPTQVSALYDTILYDTILPTRPKPASCTSPASRFFAYEGCVRLVSGHGHVTHHTGHTKRM